MNWSNNSRSYNVCLHLAKLAADGRLICAFNQWGELDYFLHFDIYPICFCPLSLSCVEDEVPLLGNFDSGDRSCDTHLEITGGHSALGQLPSPLQHPHRNMDKPTPSSCPQRSLSLYYQRKISPKRLCSMLWLSNPRCFKLKAPSK
jgi:hypothetical protein